MPSLNLLEGGGLDDQGSAPATGRAYWKSLEHLSQTPEFRAFVHHEFPAGAMEALDSTERRTFLKVMGASMALAGLGMAGCRRWPEKHVLPYASRPAESIPGTPQYFATSVTLAGVAHPVLAASYDGRPIKLEGNPEHPASRGASTHFTQAALLDLYDPDRSRSPAQKDADRSWDDYSKFAAGHFETIRSAKGAGLAILCGASDSPSLLAMRRRMESSLPQAQWFEYEPLLNDNAVAGLEQSLGSAHRALLDLSAAKVIVSLDADLFGCDPAAVTNIRQFADGRRLENGKKEMNRLYAIEAEFTTVGAAADRRVAMRSTDIAAAAAYIASRVASVAGLDKFESAAGASSVFTSDVTAALTEIVEDLTAHRGESVVVAGASQPAIVHAMVAVINDKLGNVGRTIAYAADPSASAGKRRRHLESIRALAGEIVAGRVQTLVILGGNPAYDAPVDLDFQTLLSTKAGTVIHLADHRNETSKVSTWHINRAHALEAWGDGRSWDGSYTLQQPLIEPLFGGRSEIELLAMILGEARVNGREIVQETFAQEIGGRDDRKWKQTLHDGFLAGSAATKVTPTANTNGLAEEAATLASAWSSTIGQWEIAFRPHPTIYDGRFANNGWLQELPDPLTKLTWDNALLISPASADELGVKSGDLVRAKVENRSIEAPVFVLPGIANKTAVAHLGFGRQMEGRICKGAGFNFGALRGTEAPYSPPATIDRASGSYTLATTQDHHTINANSVGGKGVQKRLPSLVREADLNEYAKNPSFAAGRTHVVHRLSVWEETNLDGAPYRWGMAIDLNACVGCNACITACQAENNIPVVGKDQISRGREMHWLRVDRYFRFAHSEDHSFDTSKIESVVMQPLTCQHCENAPCEQVCPVAATVHDQDGLNVMVYNRCIGTRYCSNNCPYKVRRFNYFDYHMRTPMREQHGLLQVQPDYYAPHQATPHDLIRLQFNPDVSVRMRGVMEKCTYCVQRITRARIAAKNEFTRLPAEEKQKLNQSGARVAIADGAVTPACAQACPAQAIVFGDLADSNSRVARLQREARSYEMLEELNVKTRTRYLAKVRNPHGGGSEGGDVPHG